MSIASEITRLNNAKTSIKNSIINKGVTVSDTKKIDEYSTLIDSIETKKPEQSKTVTPSESVQNITPDNGYTLSQVTVEAISKTYVGSNVTKKSAQTYTPTTTDQIIASDQYLTGTQTIKGDSNLTADNIKSGTSIFGVTGNYAGSTPNLQSKSVTYTSNGTATVTPDSGYDGLSSVDVTVNVAGSGGNTAIAYTPQGFCYSDDGGMSLIPYVYDCPFTPMAVIITTRGLPQYSGDATYIAPFFNGLEWTYVVADSYGSSFSTSISNITIDSQTGQITITEQFDEDTQYGARLLNNYFITYLSSDFLDIM